jgi:hypothetical protein
MNTMRTTRWMPALATLLVLGCGGGGGSGGGNSPTAGIDRGGKTVSQGPINGFGSVIVNGVRYSTTGAVITINNRPGVESELRVGQVVRVEGKVEVNGTTGTATRIEFNADVEGPVQSIDLAASRMVVLGQVVQVGPVTSFDDRIVPRSLAGLAIGDRVEVSGLVAATGVIAATRIERKAASASVEVKGTASGVDSAARRLRIGQLLVDYSAAQLDNFPSGQPANGDVVEASGQLNAAGVLLATQLERRSVSLGGTVNDKAELEGLVTRFASTADFDVAGQRVAATASTRYEGGTAANLALNVSVEVEGAFDAAGRVVAETIEFRRTSNVEISARVEAVNAGAGTVSLLGVTVRTSALTRYEDQSDADVERFSLGDVRVGDWLGVRAYLDGGSLVASLLERDDPEDRVEVSGPASSVAAPNFSVAGVAVTTDARTEFRDKDGGSISAATFFAAAPGQVVKVRGSQVGNAVLAERAEFDD